MTSHEAVPGPELVTAFVGRLRQHGVQLWVTGEAGSRRLRVQAPAGCLSADDRRRLARWKDAIIATVLGADGDTPTADTEPHRQIGQIGQIPPLGAEAADVAGANAPCPRCARLEAQAAGVLEQLSAHPALPPALRAVPPERLGVLVKWTIVSLTNPRPQWPPPRPTAAQRKHRRPLDALISDFGGHASGAELAAEEDDAIGEDGDG
jgi:hypothetical protein